MSNEWGVPAPVKWPELKANPHCCEEASLSSSQYYIPCNKPAAKIVGWKGRSDAPIRMCEMCSDHNVKNRGGYIVELYDHPDLWTKETMEFDAAMGKSLNPWDNMNEDTLLLEWQKKKDAIETAKAEEMDLRKYIVGREFPKAQEGMNNKDLGNGYTLKAAIKYNYNLADNDTVEATLEKLSKLGNAGAAISDRLVSWTPTFKLAEYRVLQEEKEKGNKFAIDALNLINDMLTIKEAAPTLEIKAPKVKK